MTSVTRLEILETSTISWDNETLSVKDWAERRGLPVPFAIDALKSWIKAGTFEIEAKVHLRPAAKTDSQIQPQPRRRGRKPKSLSDEGAGKEAALKLLSESSLAPANLKTVPKRDAATVDAELTWDARLRAHVIMNQPWGDDWPPMATCPPEILQRYGVAA